MTTRARRKAGSAMHDLLEEGLAERPDVGVTLIRSGKLVFSEDPTKTAAIANQVVTAIKERVTAAAGQPVTGSIPIPELGLTAMLHDAGPISAAGLRVTYEPPLTDEQQEHRWKMAALQIKDSIEKKASRPTGCRASLCWTCPGWARRARRRLRHRGRASSRTYWMPASWATSAARWWCVRS